MSDKGSIIRTPSKPKGDISTAITKILTDYEQKNRDLMAEVHNKILGILVESKLTLPYISIMLNMLLNEVVDKGLSTYGYKVKQE